MSSESPVLPGLDGVDVEIVEFASAGNDSLAHGSTPDAIVAKAGPPHSAKYVTVVVVPLPVLIDADTGKSARVENRLPIGRIEAGAIILHPDCTPAHANSNNSGSDAVRVAEDRHTVTGLPVHGLSIHRAD